LRLIERRRSHRDIDDLDEVELEDRWARSEADRAVARIDVDRALRELSAHERLLIGLRYGQDCSHPEIAAALQIPEGTARVRLHRAHQRLKFLL
jgi:RNA polymerase sigma-70 factor (ECF subfamily)